jgi:hypothetical protein
MNLIIAGGLLLTSIFIYMYTYRNIAACNSAGSLLMFSYARILSAAAFLGYLVICCM